MTISLQNRQKKYGLNRKKVLQWTRGILSLQRLEKAEVGLVFVNDRQIRTFNRSYRNQDKATDVLAFPMLEGEGGGLHPGFLGDVMISLEMSEKEADLYGRAAPEQLLILLIHGILHLIGYDHERSLKEAKRMRRREKALFKHLYK